MRIGFYAPLKPPDHPAPSGDRRIARLFMDAMRGMGHDVDLLSTLRSYNRDGNPEREAETAALAAAEVARLSTLWQQTPALKPDLLFTYHVYHKAADYIGPALKQQFGLPYAIAEASHSPARRTGIWAAGYAQALQALTMADALLAITNHDLPGLAACTDPTKISLFPPFLDPAPFLEAAARRTAHRERLTSLFGLPADRPWLLAVGMMRAGDKQASFERLAETLLLARDADWHAILVGGGPELARIEAAFAPLRGRVTTTGQLEADALAALYAACDLYVWPAVNEAYGMALLEAQAAGLPVLSVDTRGVPDIVRHLQTGWLTADDAPATLAVALQQALADTPRRRVMAEAALQRVQRELSLTAAQHRLDRLFRHLGLPA